MRYLLVILMLMFCLSCLGSNDAEVAKDAGLVTKSGIDQHFLWVCHHPGSKFHNQLCVDGAYPDGCYVHGDRHKFCWLLTREECNEESESAALQACELFEELPEDHAATED